MQSIITAEELDTANDGFYKRLHEMRARLVQESIAPLLGRGCTTTRKLKDPVTHEFKDHQVVVTVTGGGVGYDDDLQLEGTYVHPHSGKIVETVIDA